MLRYRRVKIIVAAPIVPRETSPFNDSRGVCPGDGPGSDRRGEQRQGASLTPGHAFTRAVPCHGRGPGSSTPGYWVRRVAGPGSPKPRNIVNSVHPIDGGAAWACGTDGLLLKILSSCGGEAPQLRRSPQALSAPAREFRRQSKTLASGFIHEQATPFPEVCVPFPSRCSHPIAMFHVKRSGSGSSQSRDL